jgi:hypothetical protein
MREEKITAPDNTAVRVAMWRAMHVQVDPPPHVIEDEVGLRVVAPDEDWRRRPDMDPHATRYFRASIVARARFIEDLVVEEATCGMGQYIILGAGLARMRFQGGPACFGSRSDRALLRGEVRWPSPAKQFRGTPIGEDLSRFKGLG